MTIQSTCVCAVVVNKEGLLLSVSRKNNALDKGWPGGKIEPGESMEQAVIREVKEETGYTATIIRAIYAGWAKEHFTTAFLCTVTGEISTEETGKVEYIKWGRMLDDCNSFAEYNREVAKRYFNKHLAEATYFILDKIDQGDYVRADGDSICSDCHLAYKYHQRVEGFEWLNIICDGTLIKT